ncbi:eukaryotic translation initiation factor eif1 [Anaeramoeba flamelloides]|uniref:Eukaryotic translation initiation factor eif1 n=1 Tax=Anaeramoeba flamelloides TaxID=1746091 RepID=A0ABQ8XME5_9EUKA|nr:eukaryotic translation initiation factor eif1 [Anaeramoeba flamelloides]
MTEIKNLETYDPFEDVEEETKTKTSVFKPIHLRVKTRRGKKKITTIENLSSEFDLKMLIKVMRKKFCCSGSIVNDERLGEVIQLSGDQREAVAEFLIEEEITTKKGIKIHGN